MPMDNNYLQKFAPYRDEHDRVSETPHNYALRIQSNFLPHWPRELLIEWLYRHNRSIDRYAFLRFENLYIRMEKWPLNNIPGREAFHDPNFCDNFCDIEQRAQLSTDWLANYMLTHGTWNTPIALLENPQSRIIYPNGQPLQSPFHLLEGHRRLSFLNGLKQLGKANSEHSV